MYTGTADGKIVVIEQGEVRTLTTFGKPPCGKNLFFVVRFVIALIVSLFCSRINI